MKRLLAAGGLLATVVACGADFSPKNEIQAIRILAAKADIPYAHVGETINLEALAYDGRRTNTKKPMRVFWFPAPCINPPGDQYYFCYAAIAQLPERQNLTPILVESTKTSITIPQNALDGVVLRPGQTERFVTAYNFVVACAGHVERIPLKSGLGLNQIPVGCFDDETGLELGDGAFVLGFTRVFVFDTRRNTVPVLDGVTFEGQPVDTTAGVKTGKCVKDKNGQCKTVKFNVSFPDANAEIDPDNVDSNGNVLRETIYVDWFTTNGFFRSDRKIVYDGNLGRPPKTDVEYEPPNDPVTGAKIWAILHDNRGGTVWREFPLEIQ
ncbi:MAG: hypothetical protein U0270_17865 [Labilithrix sp.]